MCANRICSCPGFYAVGKSSVRGVISCSSQPIGVVTHLDPCTYGGHWGEKDEAPWPEVVIPLELLPSP